MELAYSWMLLLALAAFIYGPWQKFWEDWGRQRLFEIRDDLFDCASAGQVAFDSQEYRTIRNSYNSAIRFMHELTWTRLLFLYFAHTASETLERKSDIESVVDDMPDGYMKKRLHNGIEMSGRVMLIVVICRSPILLSISFVGYLLALVFDAALHFGLRAFEKSAYLCSFQIIQRDAELARPIAVQARA